MMRVSRCLFCGKSLSGESETSEWHLGCSRIFFGFSAIPDLDFSLETLEQVVSVAVSAGTTVTGVQKKMSLGLVSDSERNRLTLIPAGFILKLPVQEYPELPVLEQVLMSVADSMGIRTVPHALIRLANRDLAYITRRIDRKVSGKDYTRNRTTGLKIDMEDLCQLSERLTEDTYKGSYEQCGRRISRFSSRPGLDVADFFFLNLFSFVTGNADMHLKNFSLIHTDTGYILAPVYDLVPTRLLISEDTEEIVLSMNGKKNTLTHSDFIALGENLRVPPKAMHGLMNRVLTLPAVRAKSPAYQLLSVLRQTELMHLVNKRCRLLISRSETGCRI